MTARADDQVAVIPAGQQSPWQPRRLLIHHGCNAYQAPVVLHREQLDPMALGICHFCRQRLPVPPTTGDTCAP